MRLLFLTLAIGTFPMNTDANTEIKYLDFKEGSYNIITPMTNCIKNESNDLVNLFDIRADELRKTNPNFSNTYSFRKIEVPRNIEYCKPWVEWQIQVLDGAVNENKNNQNNLDYIPYDIERFIQDVHDALIRKSK